MQYLTQTFLNLGSYLRNYNYFVRQVTAPFSSRVKKALLIEPEIALRDNLPVTMLGWGNEVSPCTVDDRSVDYFVEKSTLHMST